TNARAAVTKALRQAGLLTGGNGNNGNGNGDNGNGDQPGSTGKSVVPTGQQQSTGSAAKAGSSQLTSTGQRQAAAVGSVFVNSGPASNQPTPASLPARHPLAAKHAQPRTQLVAPPAQVVRVQNPIQLAEAGLSMGGAGPLVLLGLVGVGGLATVLVG